MRRAKDYASLVEDAREFVHRPMRSGPDQRQYAECWLEMLAVPVSEIVLLPLADISEADSLRDTAPVFDEDFFSEKVHDLFYGFDALQAAAVPFTLTATRPRPSPYPGMERSFLRCPQCRRLMRRSLEIKCLH